MSTGQDNPARSPPATQTDPGLAILGMFLDFGGGVLEKAISIEGDKVKTDKGNTYSLAEALALAQALAPPPPPPAPPAFDWTPVVAVGGLAVVLLVLVPMLRR